MANQYLRKISVLVYGSPPPPGGTGLAVPNAPATGNPNASAPSASQTTTQPGIILSDFKIQFHVTAMDVDIPPTASIRIYNLADTTAEKIKKEFQSVTLQAGYENGNYGVIFTGTIIRVRKGKLSNIDTFIDILASNLDALYNFGFVNTSIPAGSDYAQQVAKARQAVNSSSVAQGEAGALKQGLQVGQTTGLVGGTLPRGKVLFGLWPDHFKAIANSTGTVWSIGPDGVVNFHPLTGYLPGTAVVLNAQTGLIGVPVATLQGIELECLLNPLIKIGTQLKLDNAGITTTTNKSQVGFPAYADIQSSFIASTSTDGTYMALVVEHEGDNRDAGASWLTKIICLAIDSSGNSGAGKVAAY